MLTQDATQIHAHHPASRGRHERACAESRLQEHPIQQADTLSTARPVHTVRTGPLHVSSLHSHHVRAP